MNVESFPALSAQPGLVHGFTLRVPGLDVRTDRETALSRLETIHRQVLDEHGAAGLPLVLARQVHGNDIAVVDQLPPPGEPAGALDGLVTSRVGICLGIHVADCCAIYFVDPVRRVIGLAHSGKKGTEQEIGSRMVETMRAQFRSRPEDLVVQLSPCIRPPDYEVDFAAEIRRQCRKAGVQLVHDCGRNTAADLSRYYSYRVEKGQTGRMLAFLALRES